MPIADTDHHCHHHHHVFADAERMIDEGGESEFGVAKPTTPNADDGFQDTGDGDNLDSFGVAKSDV